MGFTQCWAWVPCFKRTPCLMCHKGAGAQGQQEGPGDLCHSGGRAQSGACGWVALPRGWQGLPLAHEDPMPHEAASGAGLRLKAETSQQPCGRELLLLPSTWGLGDRASPSCRQTSCAGTQAAAPLLRTQSAQAPKAWFISGTALGPPRACWGTAALSHLSCWHPAPPSHRLPIPLREPFTQVEMWAGLDVPILPAQHLAHLPGRQMSPWPPPCDILVRDLPLLAQQRGHTRPKPGHLLFSPWSIIRGLLGRGPLCRPTSLAPPSSALPHSPGCREQLGSSTFFFAQ